MNSEKYPHYDTTLLHELIRIIFSAPLRALASGGIILVIALKFFNATPTVKAMLLMAPFFGLLLTPLLIQIVAKFKIPVSKITAILLLTSSVGFFTAAFTDNYWVFIASILTARPFSMMITPAVTALWRQNIPPHSRGTKFSNVNWIGIISSLIVGGIFFFWFKARGVDGYPAILITVATGLLFSAVASFKTPSMHIVKPGSIPYSSLAYLWRDPFFGYICLCWSIMGLAQIATVPLRVEYIASGNYGMKYSSALVLLVMQIIPQTMVILTMPFWGKIFDKHNFVMVRIVQHFAFFISVSLFFLPNVYCQIIGSCFFGLASGGGMVSWNLWVTKLADKEKTAEYMSVHTCLCGIRGIIAPVVTYYFLDHVGVVFIARIGAAVMLLSVVMLLPIIKIGHRRTVSN